ncbi:eukaryotic aspartyl protease [Podospora aff. communis PSN243]|uniref:Eukaryotic aspartyl protease n=1 Tax=Podospora aff. communis PSN243 TaxID=3040156 RepID=A0AAV9GK23_9PEZI|nr:eukaryotic aspartyl protease [Podospora aff. communis PSN243]
MATSSFSSFILIFSLLSFCAIAIPEPRPASWSSKTFGPDGPWNAVEVVIGGVGQNRTAVFPGHAWHSWFTSTDYCFLTSSDHCNDAGGYPLRNSGSSRVSMEFLQPAQEWMAGVRVAGEDGFMYLDDMDLLFKGDNTDYITKTSLAIISDQMLALPNGTQYPALLGCLSLGSPEANQTFVEVPGPNLNGTMIPWPLAKRGATPSSSFGLHIGSGITVARMQGSLFWGGYDRNRVVGDVLALDGGFYEPILLKNIAITVVKGASPFAFPSTSKPGLLAQGNSSLSSSAGLPIVIDPCSPYLSLPRSTCDAIASHLPVTYCPNLGLYIWDMTSPKTTQILTSASALSFTLPGGTNTQTLTIHVPFRHLNLTLSKPLALAPTQYFPCYTSSGTRASVLGRAFLQDAFLSANWESSRVWLAQAPGPNIQPGSNPVGILPGDTAIQSGGNDWATSWDGFWTPLSEKQANGTEGIPAPAPVGAGNKEGEGLSAGAKAGISIGVAFFAAGLIGLGILLWRRGWIGPSTSGFARQESEIALEGRHSVEMETAMPNSSRGGGWGPVEVAGTSVRDPIPLGEVDGTSSSSSKKGLATSGRHVRSLHALA